MHADFSVELGRDDPALELPWTSDDPEVRYYNLKSSPDLVLAIPEAVACPELSAFLTRINAPDCPLATAKCDAWPSREISPEEEIFGDRKFVSYVDLVFAADSDRYSLAKHEEFAKELCRLLGHAPDIAATIEIVIRRCYYHPESLVSTEIAVVGSLNVAADRAMARAEEESVGGDAMGREIAGHVQEGGGDTAIGREMVRHVQDGGGSTAMGRDPAENEGIGGDATGREMAGHEQGRVGGDAIDREITEHEQMSARTDDKNQSKISLRFDGRGGQAGPEERFAKGCLGKARTLDRPGASVSGFCCTVYVTGFGDSDHEPRRRWGIALTLLQHALVQLTHN